MIFNSNLIKIIWNQLEIHFHQQVFWWRKKPQTTIFPYQERLLFYEKLAVSKSNYLIKQLLTEELLCVRLFSQVWNTVVNMVSVIMKLTFGFPVVKSCEVQSSEHNIVHFQLETARLNTLLWTDLELQGYVYG